MDKLLMNPNEADKMRARRKREDAATRPRSLICEVCQTPGFTVFDHDHQTGKFRGWLCMSCNKALGLVKDRSDILQALILYLEDPEMFTNRLNPSKSEHP